MAIDEDIGRNFIIHCSATRDGIVTLVGELPDYRWLMVRATRQPTTHELQAIAGKALTEGLGGPKAILLEEGTPFRLSTFSVTPSDLPVLRQNITYEGQTLPVLSYATNFISIGHIPEISRFKLDVVNMRGDLYVCKFGGLSDFPIEKELANYFLLRNSPYVMKPVALVRRRHAYFTLDDPTVQYHNVVDGFMLPFMGALSTLWLPREWTVAEKEVLAVHLIDAVSDIELRGVYLSDVKSTNVLLTPEGMKIIDLDDVGYTWPNWLRLVDAKQPRQRTTSGLAATLCQLFTEQAPEPEGDFESLGVPKRIAEIVRRCTRAEYHSVSHMRNETWELLQDIRAREVSVADLVAKRQRRLNAEARSYSEWWLGKRDDDPKKTWMPTFQTKTLPPLPDPPPKPKRSWMRAILQRA